MVRNRPYPDSGGDSMYDYARSADGQYTLLRDGKQVLSGTEYEIWKYLHKTCSCSVDWALKYEGWSIAPLDQS